MNLPVFYMESIGEGNILTLNEDTSRHVVQVLRMKPAEKLQLTDGAGNLLTTEIIEDHKKKCTVKIVDRHFIPQKERRISVGIGLLKNGARFEWFLEKATEIGVTDIIPLLTDRTEKQHFRYDRMKQIVVSAMMQSQQTWLPSLHQPTNVSDVVNSSTYETRLIAHCMDDEKKNLQAYQQSTSVQILIGPEGDFTKTEVDEALAKGYGAVSLGDTRLRTETAGIVAATLLCIS